MLYFRFHVSHFSVWWFVIHVVQRYTKSKTFFSDILVCTRERICGRVNVFFDNGRRSESGGVGAVSGQVSHSSLHLGHSSVQYGTEESWGPERWSGDKRKEPQYQ